MGLWTESELDLLRERYSSAAHTGQLRLDDLARTLGRHKTNICRKARELGLTAKTPSPGQKDRRMFKTKEELFAYRSKIRSEYIATNGHPRGMLGKHHSEETKRLISKASASFRAGLTKQQRREIADKMMKTKIQAYGGIAPQQSSRGTWAAGWREIGGYRKYYRSRWEANYARYLQWLKERGEISDWKHEPETFWFDNIKRGLRSYLPDFRVVENSGRSELHEVKGWMDARSRTTLKRMAKYHPSETIVVIREKDYNAIAKTVGPMIPDWEKSERKDRW